MSRILISIISVTYNAKEVIHETFNSVLRFLDEEVEYIVIDGGSKDGTIEAIKSVEQKLSVWISEPDNGIYDAMNKGIAQAQGKFLYFINAGDILLSLPKEVLRKDSINDIICFPVKLSNGKIFQPSINSVIKVTNTLPHQGCFYKNHNILYNTTYKVFADFALNQTLYKTGKGISVLQYPTVALHDINGISHDRKHLNEIFSVVNDNFGWKYKYLSKIYFKYIGLKNKLRFLQ